MGTNLRAPYHHHANVRLFVRASSANQARVQCQNATQLGKPASLEEQITAKAQGRAKAQQRAEAAEIARLVANRDKNPLSAALQAFVDYFNRKIEEKDTQFTGSRLAHFRKAFDLQGKLDAWKNSIPRDGRVRNWVPQVFNSLLPKSHYGSLVAALSEEDFKQLRKEGRFAKLIKNWEIAVIPAKHQNWQII